MMVLSGVVLTSLVATAVLARPAEAAWNTVILWSVVLWSVWLLWRNARDEVQLPVHLLHPFLGAAAAILLGHMLAGARVDSDHGRIALLAGGDGPLLIRLMVLALMLLLAQDVLSRVHDLRWLLTAAGIAVAAGCALHLHSAPPGEGTPAVALTGLVGVGMLLVPCLLPALSAGPSAAYQPGWVRRAFLVVRISVAAAMAALLVLANHRSVWASCLGAAAVGGSLLACGVFLRHHRRRLLTVGAALAVSGGVALYRLGPDGWLASRPFGLLGAGSIAGSLHRGGASGPAALGVSAGWLGLGCLICGMLVSLGRSLVACRGAAPGDQARAALWSAVVATSGCALLADGGLALPAAAAAAAMTWGLIPHVMVHPVRRFRGWPVVVVLAAALMVAGLSQRVAGAPQPGAAGPDDGLMHFLGAFVLTAVLLWQLRCRRWWHAVGVAAFSAGVLVLGEPIQERLSSRTFEWADATWNAVGAAAVAGAFGVIRAAMWAERQLLGDAKSLTAKYQSWGATSPSMTPPARRRSAQAEWKGTASPGASGSPRREHR